MAVEVHNLNPATCRSLAQAFLSFTTVETTGALSPLSPLRWMALDVEDFTVVRGLVRSVRDYAAVSGSSRFGYLIEYPAFGDDIVDDEPLETEGG